MERALFSIVLIARADMPVRFQCSLASALEQSYPRTELLAVGERAFLAKELASHPHVRQVPADKVSRARMRNMALHSAAGEYIAFMEAGDIWDPAKGEEQIAHLSADAQCVACCGNGTMNPARNRNLSADLIFYSVSQDPASWVTGKSIRYASQMLYRTEALRGIGGFDESFERLLDLDAALRLCGAGKVSFLPSAMFVAGRRPEDDGDLTMYADGKRLLRKYEDMFLVKRRMAHVFLLSLARYAFNNCMWLPMCGYALRGFLRAPLTSLLGVARRAIRFGRYAASFFYWRARALMCGMRLYRQLLQGSPPKGTPAIAGTICATPAAREFAGYRRYQFAGSNSLQRVAIPPRVLRIKEGAFFACEGLEEVSIPASVTVIGARAFMRCRNLKRVIFQPGGRLSRIDAQAFADCPSLQEIVLPDGLKQIGCGAFAGCVKLSHISFSHPGGTRTEAFPGGLMELGPLAFAGCAQLEALRFEEGSMLKAVPAGAFLGCSGLRVVGITGAISHIGTRAFEGCKALALLEMPSIDMVQSIGPRAFRNCGTLPLVHVPFALRRIRARTYEGCESLHYVKIPANVRAIGRRAFAGCSRLTGVMLLNPQTQLSRTSFPATTRIDAYQPDADTSPQA